MVDPALIVNSSYRPVLGGVAENVLSESGKSSILH